MGSRTSRVRHGTTQRRNDQRTTARVDDTRATHAPRARRYPPPFGKDEDCICPDSWRKTRPRNHTDECEHAFNERHRS